VGIEPSDTSGAPTSAGELGTHLALISTSGNQSYIYGTSNRLGCNIGASGLLRAATVEWVHEAIETINKGCGSVDLIGASSGFTLVTGDENALGELVRAVTLRALEEAPGLAVAGAIRKRAGLAETIRGLAEEATRLAARPGGSTARFQRIPIVAGCGSSPFPAEHSKKPLGLLSEIAHRQYEYRTTSLKTLATTLNSRLNDSDQEVLKFPRDLDQLEGIVRSGDTPGSSEPVGWVAVVHADGNGVGSLFLTLAGRVEEAIPHDLKEQWNLYREAYGKFSSALATATETAAALALDKVTPAGGTTPVIPLLVEGDDLTFVMDATVALGFTKVLIEEFTERSKGAVEELATCFTADGGEDSGASEYINLGKLSETGLSMKAGIAIVKPHYPFHAAYELSEQLATNAKSGVLRSKGENDPLPPSAIDFHMLADSSGADLDRIRSTRRDGKRERLYAGPFLVRDASSRDASSRDASSRDASSRDASNTDTWTVADLEAGIAAFAAVDPKTGRRRVSAAAVGEIREQRFISSAAAEAVLTRISGLDLGGLDQAEVIGAETKPALIVDLADVAGLWRST
jgi:hypothetical protein